MTSASPIFVAHNNHAAECGTPPMPAAGENLYRGYFENQYGEQWLFNFDRSTGEIEIRGGDIGWENSFAVALFEDVFGDAPDHARSAMRRVYGEWPVVGNEGPIILGEAERAWVASCMLAVQEQRMVREFTSRPVATAVFPLTNGGRI